MTLLILAAIIIAGDPTAASPAPQAAPSSTPAPSPDELFSRRALRRARLIIQMRVMQLREERLECIREALERRLPAALWPEVPSPSRGAADAATVARKCEELLKFEK